MQIDQHTTGTLSYRHSEQSLISSRRFSVTRTFNRPFSGLVKIFLSKGGSTWNFKLTDRKQHGEYARFFGHLSCVVCEGHTVPGFSEKYFRWWDFVQFCDEKQRTLIIFDEEISAGERIIFALGIKLSFQRFSRDNFWSCWWNSVVSWRFVPRPGPTGIILDDFFSFIRVVWTIDLQQIWRCTVEPEKVRKKISCLFFLSTLAMRDLQIRSDTGK